LRARSYLEWGAAADTPAAGAVVVLERGDDPALGHVGFLVGMTDADVFILGGNQSNAVTVAPFARDRVLGFRMPATQQSPRTANTKFDLALEHVLAMEGGWTEDPHDPGGPTNKGITLAVYAREQGIEISVANLAQLKSGLRAISDALVRSIYETRYWQPARCSALRPTLALMHFDASVNHGVGAAARILQEALGVEIDGEIGPITLRAAGIAEPRQALARYAAIRRQRYRALPHFWRFGRGWLRRVDATLAAAALLVPPASNNPSTEDNPYMTGPTDAPTTNPDTTIDTKSWWQSMTIWGTMLTAITTVLPLVGVMLGVSITPEIANEIGQNVVVVIQALGGLIGTLMALFGRARATALLQARPSRSIN
jgi:lysozyme family protein